MAQWVVALISLLAAAAGGTGTYLARGWMERGREPALIAKLMAAANEQIYASYGDLLGELRHDAELARQESRAARAEAQEARLRAAEAETRAAGAEARAAGTEAQMAEMTILIRRAVPDAEGLLREIERMIGDRPAAAAAAAARK